MSKTLPVAAFAALFLGSSAVAADLPVKTPPAFKPAPVTAWTGFYAGANVGYGWANTSAGGASDNLEGVVGGGQLGYNWQIGQFVLGAEGDFQGSGEQRSDTIGAFTFDQDIPWFATARGRIGYAFGPVMLYASGGAAWQNYKLTVSSGGASISDDTTNIGWTAGGGVEWMFAPRWSVKGEYLYMDTGDTSVTLFGVTFTGRAQNHIARVGVNYHF